MTAKKDFILTGGQTVIFDPVLASSTVLWVKRENDRYYANNTGPLSFEYIHDSAAGTITFLTAPDGDGSSDVENERVSVIYKY